MFIFLSFVLLTQFSTNFLYITFFNIDFSLNEILVKVEGKHSSSALSLAYPCCISIITFDLKAQRSSLSLKLCYNSNPCKYVILLFNNITFSLVKIQVEAKVDTVVIGLPIIYSLAF